MPKVLLVEDSPFEAAITSVELQSGLGIEVEVTDSGVGAFSSLSQAVPSLIVLDLNLPDQSGLEVCRTLKRNLETRSVPIVMFSGESRPYTKAQAYQAGADFYITKSAEGLENLQQLVRAILRRRHERFAEGY
jgi:CheY-like chemotaxis protein